MHKRLRVLFTIPNFDTAGSGKVVYDLVSGLDKEHFDVEIACDHGGGDFFENIKSLGVKVHYYKTKTSYRPYLSLMSRVLKISSFFRTQQYDIIHSWNWSSDWTEPLAARFARVKWIYTKKAMSWGNFHWKIRSFLANFIVTINEEMTDYFPYKKNQELIPLGLDTTYYNPELFQRNDRNHNAALKIITVANLVPVKGVEVLIKAFSMLSNNEAKLVVLGDNETEYSEFLKTYCKDLKINEKVEFIKRQDDVRPYLVDADLYVIPTLDTGRKEGMPMALVEAMSMGIPVLGSNISGINFVLKDFKKLMFTAGNADSLKDKIEWFIDKPIEEREALGFDLRNYVEANFSIDGFISAHEKLYNELNNKLN